MGQLGKLVGAGLGVVLGHFALVQPVLAQGVLAQGVVAQGADRAGAVVEALDTGLLAAMRSGNSAGAARVLAPVLERAFDIPLMTRLCVGPAWNGFSPAEQASVTRAFRAMMVAQYAANFQHYAGEKITLAGPVEPRGGDVLVRTTLNSRAGAEPLHYRLRQTGGEWRIIDVYYRNSISQLATRRAEFAAIVAKGGAAGLVAHLQRLAQ